MWKMLLLVRLPMISAPSAASSRPLFRTSAVTLAVISICILPFATT